jgi:Flp pilus assembly protein TadD
LSEAPADLRSYDDLASAYAAAGRIDQAVEISRRALEISPTHDRALNNLQILTRSKELPAQAQ